MRSRSRLISLGVAAAAWLLVATPASAAVRPWPAQALTTDHETGLTANHELASRGDDVFLTYVHEPTAGVGDLIFRRSADRGRSWTAPTVLFSTGANFTELAGNLAIAASGDLVVIAFRAHDATRAYLFTVASHDGGQTWDPRVRVARNTTSLRMGIPALAITAIRVVVGWTDRDTGRIYTRTSADGGATYAPPMSMGSTSFSFICGDPSFTDGFVSLGAAGNDAYVAWTADRSGGCEPATEVLRRSTDGGRTWQPRLRLPDTEGTQGWPEISAMGDQVALLAPISTGGNLLLHSNDAGKTFVARAFVPASPAVSFTTGDVDFATDGTLRMAYGQYATSSDGTTIRSARLIVRASADDGTTWGARSVVAEPPSGMLDATPNLVDAGGLPAVAFNQSTPDESTVDILFARLVTFGTP